MLKWEPHRFIASEDGHVAVFGVMSTQAHETGHIVEDSPWALDFTVADGLITGWRAYIDKAATEWQFTSPQD
jgi:hypothetical protein